MKSSNKRISNVAATAVMLMFGAVEPLAAADFDLFLGRFHPMLLHLPIGILLMTYALEWLSRLPRFKDMRAAVPAGLIGGLATAAVSALLGYLLSGGGGYDADYLGLHQWLGFAVVVLSAATTWLHFGWRVPKDWQKAYMPVFSACIAVLMLAGHFGGTLTHGSTYLTQHAPAPLKALLGEDLEDKDTLDNHTVFANLVQPVFESKCVSCHSSEKKKGQLILATAAGVQAGGESGPAIVAGDSEESLLIERIILPLAHDEHMPPEGKRQLTETEIEMLTWWVEQGAPIETVIAEMETPDPFKALMAEPVKSPEERLAAKMAPLDTTVLFSLQAARVPVRRIAQSLPFVEARFDHQKELATTDFAALGPAAEQITALRLAYSDTRDSTLAGLPPLPNLRKLHLQQTAITDSGLALLPEMPGLEYLNLYGTAVTDKGLVSLSRFPALKQLFVWQTGVTDEGIAALKEALPDLEIDTGVDASAFRNRALLPPRIRPQKMLFDKEMTIVLETNIDSAKIHYTLNGSDPDSTSPVYDEPLKITKSRSLAAVVRREGRPQSPVAKRDYKRISHIAKDISLAQPPHEKYPGAGAGTLIDLVLGEQDFGARTWCGFEGNDLVATLDLGKTATLRKVAANCLENTGVWIFFPKSVEVSVSGDGETFRQVGKKSFPVAGENTEPSRNMFEVRFKPAKARYLRIKVENIGEVPAWHDGAGGKAWVFVDEIVLGG